MAYANEPGRIDYQSMLKLRVDDFWSSVPVLPEFYTIDDKIELQKFWERPLITKRLEQLFDGIDDQVAFFALLIDNEPRPEYRGMIYSSIKRIMMGQFMVDKGYLSSFEHIDHFNSKSMRYRLSVCTDNSIMIAPEGSSIYTDLAHGFPG